MKEFSKVSWGSKVETYCTSLHGIDDTCWIELLEACGVHSDDSELKSDSEDDNNIADLSLLDNNQALVFNFQSPTKTHI